jgi:hypothetical protein
MIPLVLRESFGGPETAKASWEERLAALRSFLESTAPSAYTSYAQSGS